MPANPSDSLLVLVDGAPFDVPSGTYTIGGAFVELQRGNQLAISVREPGLTNAMATTPDAWTRVRFGRQVDSELVQPNPAQPLTSLSISLETALVGHYAGLLGTPNGNVEDELTLPNGTTTEDLSAFVEAWRVTDQTKSLFTYAAGEGPQSWNKVQDMMPPTPEQLAGQGGGRNYVGEIETLLKTACRQDDATLDAVLVLQLAYDLAAGRPTSDMLDSGLCYDERLGSNSLAAVASPVSAGLVLQGRITFSGDAAVDPVAGQGVGGVSVRVTSPMLGGSVCATISNTDGSWGCSTAFDPRVGESITLVVSISAVGVSQQSMVTVTTPPENNYVAATADFTVDAPARVRISGVVRDASGSVVPAAPVRISAPIYLEGVADANGHFEFVLVPAAVGTSVSATVEAADPTFKSSSSAVVSYTTTTGVVTVTRDLQLVKDQAPAPVEIRAVTTRSITFTGQVRNSLATPLTDAGISNLQVRIRAPGSITGDECLTYTNGSGAFTCTSTIAGEGGFIATAAVAGFSAQAQTFNVAAGDLPAPGERLARTIPDIVITPTMIVVDGRVTSQGVPVAGAQISLTVTSSQFGTSTSTTPAAGTYHLTLFLPGDYQVKDPSTQTFTYLAVLPRLGGTSIERLVVPIGILTPGTLNTRQQDLAFVTRTFRFAGKVANKLAGGQGVPRAIVKIYRTDGGETLACQTQSDTEGLYGCDFVLATEAPFTVKYEVTQAGALVVPDVVVTPMGDATVGAQLVSRGLDVSPTTISVSGVVRDAGGAPVVGQKVRVQRTQSEEDVVTTDAGGRYTHVFSVVDAVTTLNFTVLATDGVAQKSAALGGALVAGAINAYSADFTFAAPTSLALAWQAQEPSGRITAGPSSPVVGPDGAIYTVGVFASANGPVYKLVRTDPTTHATTVSPVTIPLADLGGNGSRPRVQPVVGTDAQGATLIFVASDGNKDGVAHTNYTDFRAYLYAFAADLKLRWSTGVPDIDQRNAGPAPAVGADGTLYFLTQSNGSPATSRMYALRASDGVVVAQQSMDNRVSIEKRPVVGKDGTVYFSVGGAVAAYLPYDGSQTLQPKWAEAATCDSRNNGVDLSMGSDPVGGADVIYAGGPGYSGDSEVTGLCAIGAQGNLLWRLDTNAGTEEERLTPRTMPSIGTDGTLWFVSQGSYGGSTLALVGLDPSTRAVRHRYALPKNNSESRPSNAVVGADGTIYFTAWENAYAVTPGIDGTATFTSMAGDLVGATPVLTDDGVLLVIAEKYIANAYVDTLLAVTARSGGLAASPWPRAGGDNRNQGRRR